MLRIYHFRVFILVLSLISCTVDKPDTELDIIAKVGDRIITKQDLIHRAEYTIRPLYCRQSNYIHKKIILNSLIAEKLFSFEAEKNKIDLLDDIRFQSFIKYICIILP